MSKAFTNEDAPAPQPDDVVRRTEAMPITPRGLARLTEEHRALVASRQDTRRLRQLTHVLETVYVIEPTLSEGRAAFGARVTLETEDGETLVYELVGPDEADPRLGRISAGSAVARAILGKRVGDSATLRRPKGDIEVQIRELALPE